jgi:hypothetical protein
LELFPAIRCNLFYFAEKANQKRISTPIWARALVFQLHLFFTKPKTFSKLNPRNYILLFTILFFTSCQVTETLTINQDGSGKIEITKLRDEQTYMHIAGENYAKEEIFEDTTYVFEGYIKKYKDNFSRISTADQSVFEKYKNVQVHKKQSSYEKEFYTTISQNFKTINEVCDLYKTEDYADDLKNNYALSAENHYYKVSYAFDGKIFKRIVKITNTKELNLEIAHIDTLKRQYKAFKVNQPYVLSYHFPRKIQSVSNPKSKISQDKKVLILQFIIEDCMKNPESTNLEVVLE